MNSGTHIGSALILIFCFFTPAAPSIALEIAGVTLPEVEHVAHQELKLNGAGIRTRLIIKVYVAGLYLGDRKNTTQNVLAASGAKRVTIVMLRNVGRDTFKQAIISGIEKNSGKAELAQMNGQFLKFSAIFDSIPEIKKGDVLTTDWIPGSGIQVQLNGKKMSEMVADAAFYNAILKIWLGENPVESQLKRSLLGETG